MRACAWLAVPLAIHFFVLGQFWFNAPVWDDYDCILHSTEMMARAPSLGEFIRLTFELQNEHRLAGTRLIPLALAWVTGGIDFRVVMLFGTFAMIGTFALVWAEFRKEATAPIAAAALFLILQWSYNEAFLMASAATAHLGVVFFAFMGLYFALRPGWIAALACAVGGVLAAYSQANGLLVLPLAAVAGLAYGLRRRALVFIVLAAVIWALYFTGYSRPHNHPSLLRAFDDPVKTFQMFLMIIGGIVPSLPLAQVGGAMVLATLGWVTWKGLWRSHPTVYLWLIFIIASAGAVAAARVGFGLHMGSRYSVNAALMMCILTFAVFALTRPWRPGLEAAACGAAALLWFAIVVAALPQMRDRNVRGSILAEMGESGRALGLPRLVGAYHPNKEHAERVLVNAAARGWYFPRKLELPATSIEATATQPTVGRPAVGVMDQTTASGTSVVLQGWTDIPATVAGRKLLVHPAEGIQSLRLERLEARDDVAFALVRADAILSGFRLVAEYASEEAARKGAATLCVFVEAPGQPTSLVVRQNMSCP